MGRSGPSSPTARRWRFALDAQLRLGAYDVSDDAIGVSVKTT
jgi:hypothetical protein